MLLLFRLLSNYNFARDRELRGVMERYTLDRRVEAGHFQFAALQVASRYPEVFSTKQLPLHASMDETLADVVSLYHGAFMAHNAGRGTCIKYYFF